MSAQMELGLKHWGGKRFGAGRKPNGARSGVSHLARPELKARHPVHVTMRVLSAICSLRSIHRSVKQALIAGSGKAAPSSKQASSRMQANSGKQPRASFRLIHFAILSNHLHLIVEADETAALSRGLKGLAIRIAWAVNRAMGRKRGKVFSDRYHAHVLETPREVNRSLRYVRNNYRRHSAQQNKQLSPSFRDPNSTAIYWKRPNMTNPFPTPETWLLRAGYLDGGGEIDLRRTPGTLRPSRAKKSRTSR